MAKKNYGLKKFGITVLFSTLAVFRYFFRPSFGSGLYRTGLYSDNSDLREFNDLYKRAIDEIEVDECIDSGKTEQFCRTVSPIAV